MVNWARGVGFLGGVLRLAGCTLGGPERIDPAEPYPTARGSSSPAEPGTSALRIATESSLVGIPGDSYAPKKRYDTGYTVYDEASVRKTHVPEHGDDPARERLDPGRYLLLLDRPDPHASVFRVTVEPDRTTDVRLEDLPPERAAP